MQEQHKANKNTPRHDTIGLEKTNPFRHRPSLASQETQNNSFLLCCSVAKASFMTSYRADWILGALLCEGKNQKRQSCVLKLTLHMVKPSSTRFVAALASLHGQKSKLLDNSPSSLFYGMYAECHKVRLSTL